MESCREVGYRQYHFILVPIIQNIFFKNRQTPTMAEILLLFFKNVFCKMSSLRLKKVTPIMLLSE